MRLYPEQEYDERPTAVAQDMQGTGFAENWEAALGLAFAEDLPVISSMISTTVESQRKQRVLSAMESGDIPQQVSSYYAADSIDELAAYSRDVLGLEGFITDEEYQRRREEEHAGFREYSDDIFARATGMGKVGQMAGYAHAMAVDPLYATSFLTGYGSAATAGQAFLRVAAMEAGIEAVAQVPKLSFREEIGANYRGPGMLAEIAFAGLGAGAIAGIGKGISNYVTAKALKVKHGREVFEKMVKQYPELEPIINTLKHADPEDNLEAVLKADEAIDVSRLRERPRTAHDPKSEPTVKVADIDSAEEATYTQRQPKPIDVGDEANVLQKTADKEVKKFESEAKATGKKVKKATTKYNKAKAHAVKMANVAEGADNSVAGQKAVRAARRAQEALTEAEETLSKVRDADIAAKDLVDEVKSTSDKGVTHGTPEAKPKNTLAGNSDTVEVPSSFKVDENVVARNMGKFIDDVGGPSNPGKFFNEPIKAIQLMPAEDQKHFIKMIIDSAVAYDRLAPDGTLPAREIRKMAKKYNMKGAVKSLNAESDRMQSALKDWGNDTVSLTMKRETEGVPHGTPQFEPETRHYMVVEADNAVAKVDATIKIMEECF
jgi:hypothetical protein